MRIEHVALWVSDLEKEKAFYLAFPGAVSSPMYRNAGKGFESVFISFAGGARLELMRKDGVTEKSERTGLGWAHLAFSMGSPVKVDEMTKTLQKAGHRLLGGPRVTGDGYYESLFEDPEGNLLELTI